MNTPRSTRLEIHKLRTLPALPEATKRILDAVNDPDLSLEKIAHTLAESPSLTARLLGLANSAYFGRSGSIRTIQDAIIQVLGLNLVKCITVSILLNDSLDTRKCASFDGKRFWCCAIVTSSLAQELAEKVPAEPKPDAAVAYSAGLISNIGLLAMVCAFPELMEGIFEERRQTEKPVSELLRQHYEVDQYMAGKWLAQRWQLPDLCKRVIAHHSDPNYGGPDRELVRLIGLCSDIAKRLYLTRESAPLADRYSSESGVAAAHLEIILERQVKSLEGLDEMFEFLSGI